MNKKDAAKIEVGLYRIFFLDREPENGVVGILRDGRRWYALAEAGGSWPESVASTDWRRVSHLAPLHYDW